MRALIVDDSRFVRNFLRGLLEGMGFECAEAGDGQAGVDCLEAGPAFDVALLDWNMPVMNGLDMLKQLGVSDVPSILEELRAQGFTDMKVMMVTTEAENDFILNALEAGADEYLMKPFDEEALQEKLAMLGLVGV